MNNEDKILQMLSEVLTEQKSMKKEITDLKQGQEDLKQEQQILRQGQEDLKQVQESLIQGQEELRQDVKVIKLTQETNILPNIQLLAEGHISIQNQIKNLSVIEHMQDDIATLKSAVKFLSQEVEKLNKAI